MKAPDCPVTREVYKRHVCALRETPGLDYISVTPEEFAALIDEADALARWRDRWEPASPPWGQVTPHTTLAGYKVVVE